MLIFIWFELISSKRSGTILPPYPLIWATSQIISSFPSSLNLQCSNSGRCLWGHASRARRSWESAIGIAQASSRWRLSGKCYIRCTSNGYAIQLCGTTVFKSACTQGTIRVSYPTQRRNPTRYCRRHFDLAQSWTEPSSFLISGLSSLYWVTHFTFAFSAAVWATLCAGTLLLRR